MAREPEFERERNSETPLEENSAVPPPAPRAEDLPSEVEAPSPPSEQKEAREKSELPKSLDRTENYITKSEQDVVDDDLTSGYNRYPTVEEMHLKRRKRRIEMVDKELRVDVKTLTDKINSSRASVAKSIQDIQMMADQSDNLISKVDAMNEEMDDLHRKMEYSNKEANEFIGKMKYQYNIP